MKRLLALAALLLAVLLPTHGARAVGGIGPILVPPHASAANPGDVANILTWLRADQVVSPTNGSPFASWVDLANGGATYTQSSPSDQFVWNASDSLFNNKPSVTGNGASYMQTTVSTVSVPYTVYVVNALTPSVPFVSVLATTYGDEFELKTGSAYGIWYASGNTGNLASTTTTDTSPHVIAAVFNGASSAIYVDSSTGGATGSLGTVNLTTDVILGRTGGSDAASGNIPEFVMYQDAHTSAQVHTAFAYFAARYGQTWN